jgi:hypothetical protein
VYNDEVLGVHGSGKAQPRFDTKLIQNPKPVCLQYFTGSMSCKVQHCNHQETVTNSRHNTDTQRNVVALQPITWSQKQKVWSGTTGTAELIRLLLTLDVLQKPINMDCSILLVTYRQTRNTQLPEKLPHQEGELSRNFASRMQMRE